LQHLWRWKLRAISKIWTGRGVFTSVADGYRFGGERICSNGKIRAEFLEAAVWREVCDLPKNPEELEREKKAAKLMLPYKARRL